MDFQELASLVPKPSPAFCMSLEARKSGYWKRRKAGRGLGTRLGISYPENFRENDYMELWNYKTCKVEWRIDME